MNQASPATSARRRVLVLGGGPDAEREVSIKSATGIADALRKTGRYEIDLEIIGPIDAAWLRTRPADVIFPYLHGPWGEGGPLQEIIERDGRPFVGCGSAAARRAMDKITTKAVALRLGIPTPEVFVYNAVDPACPLPFPVIVKPIHEGSTIGLHVCNDGSGWGRARDAIAAERARGVVRAYMIEPRVPGRELTVGVIGDRALPVIEIQPADGLYDYEAKYTRDDTRYLVDPAGVDPAVKRRVSEQAERLHATLGCRHISRTDFMLDPAGTAWLLEINTTPGFTDHSLVPKAARHAGIETPELCARLVEMAAAAQSDRR